ncbi:hypothetical protein [Streptomyces sp. NBC_01361]|nr:hypothetical protein [Streptomyces sp. NBC_01361]
MPAADTPLDPTAQEHPAPATATTTTDRTAEETTPVRSAYRVTACVR